MHTISRCLNLAKSRRSVVYREATTIGSQAIHSSALVKININFKHKSSDLCLNRVLVQSVQFQCLIIYVACTGVLDCTCGLVQSVTGRLSSYAHVLYVNQPTFLPSSFLPTLATHSPTHLPSQVAANLPTYPPAQLPQSSYLPTYFPTYLYLRAYLPIYPPTAHLSSYLQAQVVISYSNQATQPLILFTILHIQKFSCKTKQNSQRNSNFCMSTSRGNQFSKNIRQFFTHTVARHFCLTMQSKNYEPTNMGKFQPPSTTMSCAILVLETDQSVTDCVGSANNN